MKVKDLKRIIATMDDETDVEFFRYEYDEYRIEYYDEELVFDSVSHGLEKTRLIFISEFL
jgi:hypothetical protein